jgi:hypothetical protein
MAIKQKDSTKTSVDYHYKLKLLFYFETQNDITTLYSHSWENKSNKKIITNVGLKGAKKLTLDWIGDSIYWTNEELHRIEQIGIHGEFRRTVTTDCIEPHDIQAGLIIIKKHNVYFLKIISEKSQAP